MQREYIQLEGESKRTKLRMLMSLGLMIACTATTLATHKILMKNWKIIFGIGIGIFILSATTLKFFKMTGVKSDEKEEHKNVHPMFFKGKRLA